eukprot:2571600-Pleurochrysis_carterae.AAC.5
MRLPTPPPLCPRLRRSLSPTAALPAGPRIAASLNVTGTCGTPAPACSCTLIPLHAPAPVSTSPCVNEPSAHVRPSA